MAHCLRFGSRHAAPRRPGHRELLAILGTGVKARPHVEAMRCVRDFGKSHVWGRTPKKAAAFITKHGCVTMSVEDWGPGDDVVVTATSS